MCRSSGLQSRTALKEPMKRTKPLRTESGQDPESNLSFYPNYIIGSPKALTCDMRVADGSLVYSRINTSNHLYIW